MVMSLDIGNRSKQVVIGLSFFADASLIQLFDVNVAHGFEIKKQILRLHLSDTETVFFIRVETIAFDTNC